MESLQTFIQFPVVCESIFARISVLTSLSYYGILSNASTIFTDFCVFLEDCHV